MAMKRPKAMVIRLEPWLYWEVMHRCHSFRDLAFRSCALGILEAFIPGDEPRKRIGKRLFVIKQAQFGEPRREK